MAMRGQLMTMQMMSCLLISAKFVPVDLWPTLFHQTD
jgi:hypothetical protein